MKAPAKTKVLVTTRFFDEAAATYLSNHDCEIITAGLPHDQDDAVVSEDRFLELLDGVSAWIVGSAPVTRRILSSNPQLQIVARRGVGYDRVDTKSAAEFGKVVSITRGGNEPAVSDHAVAMMLALAKRLREGHESLQGGNWKPLAGTELFEKVVGLVGYGEIARGVARRVKGFDTEVLAYDVAATAQASATEDGVKLVSLDELFARSDYISLHVPLLPATKHMINAESIQRMKRGTIIVNTARGGLIDERDLLKALDSGQIAGAGLDVLEFETDPAAKDTADALLGHPHVIASAHSAGSSSEALARANMLAVRTVLKVLSGKSPDSKYIVADGRTKSSDQVVA